jgi:HrpA-like RNA helicase
VFQDYFNGEAPVLQIPGRLFPIQTKYMPVPSIEKSDRLNPAPYVRILQMIDKKYDKKERGDLLIFLSGLKEITIVADACKVRFVFYLAWNFDVFQLLQP